MLCLAIRCSFPFSAFSTSEAATNILVSIHLIRRDILLPTLGDPRSLILPRCGRNEEHGADLAMARPPFGVNRQFSQHVSPPAHWQGTVGEARRSRQDSCTVKVVFIFPLFTFIRFRFIHSFDVFPCLSLLPIVFTFWPNA